MRIGNATVVTIHYSLKGENGELIESATENDPLIYLHGAGNIIEGLEDGLESLEEGDSFNIIVEPKFGYGKHLAALVTTIERSRFPNNHPLEVGEMFTLESQQGPKLIRILEFNEELVKIDANHELAGKTLIYTGKILAVREATEDEMGNGYVRESGV